MNTMYRCLFVAIATAALVAPAAAQMQRNFPDKALRGEVVFGAPPEINLNGKPARLAPGARIRDENNLLQMSGALAGRKLVVNYTTELGGMLLDVWILTRSELERKPWPTTEKEAQAWLFNPDAQAWTKR
jgi:hypothetical protein